MSFDNCPMCAGRGIGLPHIPQGWARAANKRPVKHFATPRRTENKGPPDFRTWTSNKQYKSDQNVQFNVTNNEVNT